MIKADYAGARQLNPQHVEAISAFPQCHRPQKNMNLAFVL